MHLQHCLLIISFTLIFQFKELEEAVQKIQEMGKQGGAIARQKKDLKAKIPKLLEIADFLDKIAAGTGITKKVGSAVAAASTVAGIVFAPLTAGGSLALAAGGMIAGGITFLTGTLIELGFEKSKNAEIICILKEMKRKMEDISNLMQNCLKKYEKAKAFLDTAEITNSSLKETLHRSLGNMESIYHKHVQMQHDLENEAAFEAIKFLSDILTGIFVINDVSDTAKKARNSAREIEICIDNLYGRFQEFCDQISK